MTGAHTITAADREAGQSITLPMLPDLVPPDLATMFRAFQSEGFTARDPVCCYRDGPLWFAAVEFEGVQPLPAPVLLRVERAR